MTLVALDAVRRGVDEGLGVEQVGRQVDEVAGVGDGLAERGGPLDGLARAAASAGPTSAIDETASCSSRLPWTRRRRRVPRPRRRPRRARVGAARHDDHDLLLLGQAADRGAEATADVLEGLTFGAPVELTDTSEHDEPGGHVRHGGDAVVTSPTLPASSRSAITALRWTTALRGRPWLGARLAPSSPATRPTTSGVAGCLVGRAGRDGQVGHKGLLRQVLRARSHRSTRHGRAGIRALWRR